MPLSIDKIVRSGRKSISAEISKDAKVIIRAPRWVSEQFIRNFVRQKEKWILRHRKAAMQRTALAPKRSFEEGEEFLFLGKSYCLRIVTNASQRLKLNKGFELSHFYKNEARKTFMVWYKAKAAEVIGERVRHYAAKSGIAFKGVRISSAVTRWGSCSPKDSLSFPWRLVMGPLFVIDSVIAHELAHIEQRNHSARFWRRVESIYPEYEKADPWLKKNEHLLVL